MEKKPRFRPIHAAFVGGAALVGGIAGADAAWQEGKRQLQEYRDSHYQEDWAAERATLVSVITAAPAEIEAIATAKETYNTLVTPFIGRDLDELEKDPAYLAIKDQLASLEQQANADTYRIGDTFIHPSKKLLPATEHLLHNDPALDNLATIAMGVQSRWLDGSKFQYPPHLAPYYDYIGTVDRAKTKQKMDALAEYATAHQQGVNEYVQEDVLFYVADEKFDLALTPDAAAQTLDTLRPDWKQWPSNFHKTHSNDDLTQWNVFELNRILRVAEQMSTPLFQQSLFAERDSDLKDWQSEHGGIIPFASQTQTILSLPPSGTEDNSTYMTPYEVSILPQVTHFHLHAVTENKEPNVGPSDFDDGDALPSIVFTSIDKTHIVAHMYVSRYDASTGYFEAEDVLSLGSIEK